MPFCTDRRESKRQNCLAFPYFLCLNEYGRKLKEAEAAYFFFVWYDITIKIKQTTGTREKWKPDGKHQGFHAYYSKECYK